MPSMQILALLFAVLVLVKLVILVCVSPRAWLRATDPLLRHWRWSVVVYLGLAGVTAYYVFSALSIVEVGAVMLLTSFLIGASVMPYADILLKWREEMTSVGVSSIWLPLLIWFLLALFILHGVFTGPAY